MILKDFKAISSIPLGRCVGAYPVLIYINDRPSVIKSFIFLFADDAKYLRWLNSWTKLHCYNAIATLCKVGAPSVLSPYTLSNLGNQITSNIIW